MPLTVVATLRALVEPTQAEPVCLSYKMHRSHEEPGTFVFTETWQDRPHWEAHMNSPHLTAFGTKHDELTESWTLFTGEKVAG